MEDVPRRATSTRARRPRGPTRRRANKTREKILDVASKTIARQGINGLRVEDVAEKADVSTGLLYYHFESRTGLVKAAFEYAAERAPSLILRVASNQRSGYEALTDALLAELGDDRVSRDFAIVWEEAVAAAVFNSEFRPAIRTITRNWADTVAGAIERGMADGSIRKDVDPQRAARMLIVLVDGCCMHWLADSIELAEARNLLVRALEDLRPKEIPEQVR